MQFTMGKFRFKVLIRPSITIAFAFIGAFVARVVTPPEIFSVTGVYFVVIAGGAFGLLGFILPEVIEFMGKAGINVLARQIADRFPEPSEIRFGRSSKKKPSKKKYVNPIVVDTSVLVDGRIIEVVKTGFLFGTFIIIPSVIDELHKLSDSSNDLKRGRGRLGLDKLAQLKKEKGIKVEILKTEPKDEEVDAKLVKMAKDVKGSLLTLDYNLNKVASVKGVKILNLNELANAVKTAVLPQDSLDIKVSAKGKEKNQGVGYLEDGTMVVVEDGAGFRGKSIRVKVQRVFQTAAGKMIFARKAKS